MLGRQAEALPATRRRLAEARRRAAKKRGVALVMVLGAIAVLTVFLVELQEDTSASVAAALSERDAIRAHDTDTPITTNFMGAFKPANYAQWAEHMDVVSDDCYPDPNDPEGFRAAAFQRDLIRSSAGWPRSCTSMDPQAVGMARVT